MPHTVHRTHSSGRRRHRSGQLCSSPASKPSRSSFDVRAILDKLPAGRAVDAACGTGRYSSYLAGAGGPEVRAHAATTADAAYESTPAAIIWHLQTNAAR